MTPSADLPGFGRPMQPTQQETENTAANMNRMASLGIVPDTLERPFSQINWESTWKYNSNSSNPSIAMLRQMRTGSTTREGVDEQWTQLYNKLVDLLPPRIKTALIQQGKLPADQRSPFFTAAETVTGMAASTIQWAQAASQVQPTDTFLPAFLNSVRKSAVTQGSALLASIRDQLEKTGHQDPQFDTNMRLTTDLEGMLAKFKALSEGKASQEDWAQFSQDLGQLNGQIKSVADSGSLRMLESISGALTLLASANSTPSAGPLALGLGMAGTLLSPDTSHAMSLFSDAMGLKGDLAGNMVSAAGLGLASMAALAHGESGEFAFELALSLGVGSGAIQSLASGIGEAGGTAAAGNMLAGAGLLFAAHAVGKEDSDAGVALAAGLHAPLADGLDALGQVSHNTAVDVALQQGRLAMEHEDYDGLLQSTKDLEKAAGSDKTDKAWNTQQENLKQFADLVSGIGQMMKADAGSSAIVQA